MVDCAGSVKNHPAFRFVLGALVALVLSSTAACSSPAESAEDPPVPAKVSAVADGPAAREEPGTDEKDPGAPADAGAVVPSGTFVDPGPTPDAAVLARYAHLDPGHLVPKKLLDHAIAYFDFNKHLIDNQKVLTVVDFSQHSGKRRFFVVDLKSGAVDAYVVAHGKRSDPDFTGYATEFSNDEGSNMSSLGFALTDQVYVGVHGRSLRLQGLSPTNSNMLARAVVIHGAAYVVEGQDKQGRSLGCFALDQSEKDDIIDALQGGSLLYADRGA